MSTKHLTQGDEQPAKVDGKLRLYSMLYCPFAQRSRLVLKAKNVPHDIVNVNLIRKPDWMFKLNAEGKVPVLDTGDEIVVDSGAICDFLDEKYPQPALYGNKESDKAVIQKIGPLVGVFVSIVLEKEQKSASVWWEQLAPLIECFEEELKTRGTKFFGGNENPGMIDYMLWPFAERAPITAMVLGEKLPVPSGSLPLMKAWIKSMTAHPVVAALISGPDKHFKVLQFHKPNVEPNYDEL